MKTKYFILALSLLAAMTAHAQMTLDDCLRYAREHAHNNVLARLEVERSAAEKGIAASELMPYVALSSSGNISFGRNIDPETNTYDNKKTLATGFGLNVSLPFFDGFAAINNLKAAKVARLRKMSTAQVEEDLRSLEVIKAFYNVSYCQALVGQMEEQLVRDESILSATRRGEELGTKSGADVAEIEALVSSDRYELTRQQGLLDKAYLALRSSMGMPLDCEMPELIDDGYSTDSLEGSTVHPRIAEAQHALKESRYRLRAARGAFSPRISLSGGVSTSYFRMIGSGYDAPRFSHQWHDNMGQYVGFSVSIPLFTGLSATNRLKSAKIEYREQEVRLSRTVYEIERATAEAALDYETAADELIAADARVRAEEIAYRAVSRKYELGSASAIDLYTSGTKLATARAQREGKRIQKIISRICLGYYRGDKLVKD